MADVDVLRRLERGLHAAAANGRRVVATGGFTLYLSLESAEETLSLAVPVADGRTDPLGDLRAMCRAFAAHGRRPRIEYFEELHPELLAALASAGLRCETRAPVMTLKAEDLPAAVPQRGAYRRLTPGDRSRLEVALRGAHAAFGGDGGDGALEWLPFLLRGLVDDTVLVGVVDHDAGPVAGATVMVGGDVAELAGVWSHADHRRRGLARQACHALLAETFARGTDLVWLSAGEGADALYASLGFRPVGTQVNAATAGRR
jgi:ribosomal protein S18 acetylase RimI-like enzyme